MSDHRLALRQQLIRHEGLRLKPYTDTVGKLTIGVGRNLTDVGISREEAYLLLEHDIQRTIDDVSSSLPWVNSLDPVRQRVLLDMAFNLGIDKLLKFQKTLSAALAGNYELAANQMLASRWADQVGDRARTLAQMMRDGEQGEFA